MYPTSTIPVFASSTSSRNCFVIPKTFDILAFNISTKSKSEIVAISLTGSTRLESFQLKVYY